MTTIDPQQVQRLAKLARLDLSDDERARYAGQLDTILRYVEQLAQVDTSDCDPLAHPLPLTDVLRGDVPAPGLDQQDALANAPARHQGFFKVPTVLDQTGGA